MLDKKIYIKSLRFHFSYLEELLFKLIVIVFYIFFVGITFSLIFSENQRLIALGFVFLFFLINKLLFLNKAPKTVLEIKENGGNIIDALTPQALRILIKSFREFKIYNSDIHLTLLNNLLKEKEIKVVFRRLNINPLDFIKKAKEIIEVNKELDKLAFLEKVLIAAFQNAIYNNDLFIYPRNILASICDSADSDVEKLFNVFSIKREDIILAVNFGKWKNLLDKLSLPRFLGGFGIKFKMHKKIMNRAWTARPTPTLDKYGEDLTLLARERVIGFMIGHEEEINTLINILSKPNKNNALLIGEAGIGKETIVNNLAYRIIKDNVPEVLFDKRVVALNLSNLTSSASHEELAERIKNIFFEIEMAGNVILYVQDIHNLFKTKGESNLNIFDLFLPFIKSSNVSIIGATYPLDFKRYIEKEGGFMDYFEIIRVQELKEEESLKILIYQAILWESKFKVFIPYVVLKRAVYLAKRFFHQKPLPGSAISLVEELVSEAVKERKKEITLSDLNLLVERKTKIPVEEAEGEEARKLLNLEEIIHQSFINQDDAVFAVARALREFRSGLSRKGGPIASFLFVGPTGVGKTELSKILAKIQFGSEEAMIRLDMSEYQDQKSIYKLLGHPDEGVGGYLTEAVYEKPYSLVLLDEFEKAHPNILNIFLQVFDDGRLTDSFGKFVDFQNTIIIATSNADSSFIKEEIEKGRKFLEIKEDVKKRLTNYFKPELLNRFSDVIVFRDLNKEEIVKIAELLIKKLQKTVFEEKNIELLFEDSVLVFLAEKGYDKVFGARPLRKVISEEINDVLAKKILEGELTKGSLVKISVFNNKIEFNIQKS